jgi:hypothetical protein
MSSASTVKASSERLLKIAYLALAAGWIYALLGGRGYDDPYITYRYAENLAQGQGFVYNSGERVLSTTSPLFTLLLAALRPMWADLPRLANLIGALSLAGGALLLWELARAWGTPLAGWAALVFYPTFPLLLSTLGSETPLYLALCLAAFHAWAMKRPRLAAAWAGLAALARPDGVLAAAAIAAASLAGLGRPPAPGAVRRSLAGAWQPALIYASILGAWGVFAWLYFGSPLPVTLAAKQAQGSMAISQTFLAGFVETILPRYQARFPYPLLGLLALAGAAFSLLRRSPWLLVLGWTAAYFLGYSLLQVSSYFWYYAPLVPAFAALAGLGLDGLLPAAGRWISQPRLRAALNKGLAGVLLLLVIAPWHWAALLRLAQQPDPRLAIYRAAGEWIQANTPSQASLGLLEAGIIGYYARRPVVDFAGLLQPEVARQFSRQTTYEDGAVWAADRYRPEYLLLQEGLFPRLEQGYAARCRQAQRFAGAAYGYPADLILFDCR